MKAVVLLLALCLVAAAASERRPLNPKINQKMMERMRKFGAGSPAFPGILKDAAGRADDATCSGVCVSMGGTEGMCRQKCLPGELFERSQNCNRVPGEFCSCCVAAEILN